VDYTSAKVKLIQSWRYKTLAVNLYLFLASPEVSLRHTSC